MDLKLSFFSDCGSTGNSESIVAPGIRPRLCVYKIESCLRRPERQPPVVVGLMELLGTTEFNLGFMIRCSSVFP